MKPGSWRVALLAFAVAGCAGATESSNPSASQVATSDTATILSTQPPQSTLPLPSVDEYRMATTGAAEVVFDWSTDRCADDDIPDLPVRAIRNNDGSVQLISAHIETRRAVGPSLDQVVHQCEVVNRSTHSADPAEFDDNTWLASPYTVDGQTIYAVMHQEFHGWEHGLTCPGENFACWYNTLTLSVSTDAGVSYQPAAPPPANLVASLPAVYQPGAGPYGVFEPSNIIEKDGIFYMFVRIDEYQSEAQRVCLMRTLDLADPTAWRMWDGADFSVAIVSPYVNPESTSGAVPCASLDDDLGILNSSITFNSALNAYVLVGVTATFLDGREVWGVLYSMSTDLIEWSPRQLLAEVELPWTYEVGDGNVFLYPSLLDPDSESRNFDTTDDTAYVYLTRFNETFHLDRDLIRIPVRFFDNPDDAADALVPFVGSELP